MKKKLIVYQNGIKECGSACLLSVIRYYGGNIELSKLVELTDTSRNGTNFYNMKIAAQQLGLSAKGYKVDDVKLLNNIREPFIIQVVKDNCEHFVVVYKFTEDKVVIMDPGKGKISLKFNDFCNVFSGNILLLEPYKPLVNLKSNNKIVNLLIPLLFRNKKIIINLFFLTIIITLLICLYSFYFQVMIDKALGTSSINLLVIAGIFMLIIIIKNLASYIRNYLLIDFNKKLDLSLLTNTFNNILLLPYNYYRNKTTGEVISRLNDLGQVKNLISKVIVTLFLDMFVILAGGIILYIINSKLFIYGIIIGMLYLIVFIIFKSITKKMIAINQENNAKLNSLMIESISGFETIKGLNLEREFSYKVENEYMKMLDGVVYLNRISNMEMFVKDLAEGIGLVLITYVGCNLIGLGELTIGGLITFNSLIIYFLNPIRNIIETSRDYFFVSSSIRRANDLLEVECEKLEDVKNKLEVKGDITFINLNYSFNNKEYILKDINLKFKSGKKILILGKSGSGKSTLLKILYKYHNINRNKVLIGDYDLCDYSLASIRSEIGYISQNEVVFTDTIRNNIILDRNIKYKDFLEVCKLTCVNEIVVDRLLGYDTLLEENAINISGGQRQRIILARMLLKKFKILLIDEGLNQIDINMERRILKNIFNRYQDKTIIIVSHRMDNMDLYDSVIKMQDGEIKEIMEKK